MGSWGEAFAQLDAYVEQRMLAANTPGVAIGLTDQDRLLRVSTYGYADLAAQVPVASGTLFEIGSVSKSFTAMALLQLHAAGRDDPDPDPGTAPTPAGGMPTKPSSSPALARAAVAESQKP